HSMARDIQHIIHAASNPVIAIVVATRAVAGKIIAGIGAEIGLYHTLVVAEYRSYLAGPGRFDDKIAFSRALHLPALRVHQAKLDAKKRQRRRARLQGD